MRKAAKAAKAAKSARLTAAGPLVRQHNAALRLKRSSQAMVQAKAPPEVRREKGGMEGVGEGERERVG